MMIRDELMITFGTVYRLGAVNGQTPKPWNWNHFSDSAKNKSTLPNRTSSPEVAGQARLLEHVAQILSVTNGRVGNTQVFTNTAGDSFVAVDGPNDDDGHEASKAFILGVQDTFEK